MRTNMEIRLLSSADAAAYKDIRLEGLKANPEAFGSSYEEEKDYPLARTESRLSGQVSYTFGAFSQGKLIGVVTLFLEDKIKLKHRANIVAMYVTKEMRRGGIGKNLMLTAIRKAAELDGIEQVYLAVNASNEPARKLYQSLGFKTYGIDKRALKINGTYYDEELMVLFI